MITVAALYMFVPLPDHAELRAPLLAVCRERRVKGTILLASEGINGTIAGDGAGVAAVLDHLRADPRLADVEVKFSTAERPPFHRTKVKLKREIVTMGVPDVDPSSQAGTYVDAAEWNDVIRRPDVVVVDARNDYEVDIGTFEGAINPETERFRDLPAWIDGEPQLADKPAVAMFCTGGIRCEKATAYLRARGFGEVYHLRGGILRYLEAVPERESLWRGECFVFDERVAVGHRLDAGTHELCRACRRPVNAADRESDAYVPGVSCPRCVDDTSAEKKAACAERQRQVELADARREIHIGGRD